MVELLKSQRRHVFAPLNASRVRLNEPEEDVADRRLAAAAGTCDGDDLARSHFDIEIPEQDMRAERFGEEAPRKHGVARRRLRALIPALRVGIKQCSAVGMARCAKNQFRRSNVDELAFQHDPDHAPKRSSDRYVMGDREQQPTGFDFLFQPGNDAVAQIRVEPLGWLVCDQKTAAGGMGDGDCGALAHSARHLKGIERAGMAKSHIIEVCPSPCVAPRRCLSPDESVHFGDLRSDLHGRVESEPRFLGKERDCATPAFAPLFGRTGDEVGAIKSDRPRSNQFRW